MSDRFLTELRGYNKEQVDQKLFELQQTLDGFRTRAVSDEQTILQLREQLEQEKSKAAQASKGNSFASLGANAQQMLASAEQTSAELVNRAKQDAASTRAAAERQAQTMINNAKLDAQHITDEATSKAATILAKAQTESESITTSARQNATKLREETAKKVTEQRDTIEIELTNTREEHDKRLAREKAKQDREIAELKAQAAQQVAEQRKTASDEVAKLKSEANDQIERALSEANKKLANVREQVTRQTTEAQRKATEITDAAKATAQGILDDAEVQRTKTISQVNAEVEQIRSDISKQQDEATAKVNDLLKQLEQSRTAAKKETDSLVAKAKDVRDEADSYTVAKRQEADRQAEEIIAKARHDAEARVEERRKAAQGELDGLQERIKNLQDRESTITQRVTELRSMFANAFSGFAFNDNGKGEVNLPVVNAVAKDLDDAAQQDTKQETEGDTAKALADTNEKERSDKAGSQQGDAETASSKVELSHLVREQSSRREGKNDSSRANR